MSQESTVIHEAGGIVGVGSYLCAACGYTLAMEPMETLPACPVCGSERYEKASSFTELDTAETEAVAREAEPDWIAEARRELDRSGLFLALEQGGGREVTEIERGWIRIGRSPVADIQLDDPTVSRRHAIVVRTDDDELRVTDDRSVNGVFVNGERTDWAGLDDGDVIGIGRFQLHVIETDASGAPREHRAHELPA